MQQVLNWITANPVAVMAAGAGVALALVCYLVLRRGRKPAGALKGGDVFTHVNEDADWDLFESVMRGRSNRVDDDYAASDKASSHRSKRPVDANGHFANVAADIKRGTPYGSKPNESARPVTQAQLEPVLARLAALEAAKSAPAPVPQGVRAWREDGFVWLWTGVTMFASVTDGRVWASSLYAPPGHLTEVSAATELHGPELQQVYESWVNRSNV